MAPLDSDRANIKNVHGMFLHGSYFGDHGGRDHEAEQKGT